MAVHKAVCRGQALVTALSRMNAEMEKKTHENSTTFVLKQPEHQEHQRP